MLYKKVRLPKRLLYKVRHHRGHGVHSPFVFNLINKVIEEKSPYYAYLDIRREVNKIITPSLYVQKQNLLAFRLVNYFNAFNILELGSKFGVNTLSMLTFSKQAHCYCYEPDIQKKEIAEKILNNYLSQVTFLNSPFDIKVNALFDAIFIDLKHNSCIAKDNFDQVLALCSEKTFLFVDGIRENEKLNQIWSCLSDNERRTAKLDFFHFGILFFNKQVSRWDYQISF